MTIDKIDAWWFAASDRLSHGDGRKIVVGKTHSLRGDIVICSHGLHANALHASRHPFDALQYASGPYLYKVRCWGDVIEHDDKLGARNREYVAMRDSTNMLRKFAREQALTVLDASWNAPDVVRLYLETGDETIRSAAGSAARSMPWNPPRAAAGSAAWSAAWSAARGAAEGAIWSAVWSAARSAARSAAWSAAESAARESFGKMVDELFA